MRKHFNLTLSCVGTLTLLFIAGCSSPDGNAANGQRWFSMHNCSACHGENANDGRAKSIAGIDMMFIRFVNILRDPPSPSMPSFSEEELTKQDAADIYVWLKTQPE